VAVTTVAAAAVPINPWQIPLTLFVLGFDPALDDFKKQRLFFENVKELQSLRAKHFPAHTLLDISSEIPSTMLNPT
jgi:hypothetical protein